MKIGSCTVRTLALLALVGSFSLALAACSSGTPSGSPGDAVQSGQHVAAPSASLGLPQKNEAQWVMPLDQYMLGDTRSVDYAQNLLVEPCMKKAGFSWSVPWRDTTATDGPSWNAVDVKLFNVDLATKWGYHLAPTADPSWASWRAFAESKVTLAEPEEQALIACVASARKTLPVLPGSAQLANGYEAASFTGAKTDPTVIAAEKRWAKCMLPQGVSDLPRSPEDMPSPSLTAKFTIRLETSAVVPNVSTGEISVATADAKCRVSSGYQTAFYNAEWNRQAVSLQGNADALQRARDEIAANAAATAKIIALHAPVH